MTKEELEGWLSSRITQEIVELFKKQRRIKEVEAAQSGLAENDPVAIGMAVARIGGYCLGLSEFIDLSWEQYLGMKEEIRDVRVEEEEHGD